jgi:hypothetical protein
MVKSRGTSVKTDGKEKKSKAVAKKKSTKVLTDTRSVLTTVYVGRKSKPELYYPVSDWRDSKAYPPIKRDSDLVRGDYLRLAWEVLRRVPRYRWHFKRISDNGMLTSRGFAGNDHYFTADNPPNRFSKWKDIPLDHHPCGPPAKSGVVRLSSATRIKTSSTLWKRTRRRGRLVRRKLNHVVGT